MTRFLVFFKTFFLSWQEKEFLRSIMKIAGPIFIGSLINSSLQLIDQLMLSSLSKEVLAAVGYVNQLYFFFIVVFISISTAGGIFFTRFYAEKKYESIKEVHAVIIFLMLVLSSLVILITTTIPHQLLSLYTKDPLVIKLGTVFLKNLAYGQPFFAVAVTYIYLFRIADYNILATGGSVVALMMNTLFNYLLIFGHCGFPKLGVLGSAIATDIARVSLFLFYFIQMRLKLNYLTLSFSNFLHMKFILIKNILYKVIPLSLADGLLILSLNFYIAIFGHISTDTGAAYSIIIILRRLTLITVLSLSPTAMILIGQAIGANSSDEKGIKALAIKFLGLGFFISLIISIFMFFFGNYLVHSLYSHLHISIKTMVAEMLLILCFFIPILFVNGLFGGGILKAGGNAKINLIFLIISNVLVSFTAVSLSYYFLKDPIIIFISIFSGDIVRLLLNIFYFNRGKWILTLETK